MSYLLNNPFFGIGLSILVYGIGEYLYHKTNRFVLFQPLFFGMLLGIGLLVLIASILKAPVQKVYEATTAIALPVAESVGGDQAIAAFAVILNSVLIYALGDHFISWFKLHKNPLGAGLGFGIAGNAVGATKAIEVSEAAGATGAIAFVIAGILVNFMVPGFAQLIGLG
ncbi:MAG: LrgB family protein [Lactiplantibacillus plantarum]|nr:LrgB family protein [Lactiplantibacillus plantarum]